MTISATGAALPPASAVAEGAWLPLEALAARAPAGLQPWLAEPGLLTARVRAACGAATQFRLLRMVPAPLLPGLRVRLAVRDAGCLVREVEFGCDGERWVFARSVFPDSTVARYPWLQELGGAPLGEALHRVAGVAREPLEYCELPRAHELALTAQPGAAQPLWARRAVYRLAGAPILVQEVFLPALGRCRGKGER